MLFSLLAAPLIAIAPPQAPAADPGLPAVFTALRDEDMRLAGIAQRLTLANAPLCTDRGAVTGLQLHDLAQYQPGVRAAARAFFGFAAPIAVEGVVPDGAAADAGVMAGDALLAIDGRPLPTEPSDAGPVTTARAVAAESELATAGADGAVTLDVLRGGARRTILVHPPAGCRTRFEVTVLDGYDSRADGVIVQISTKLIEAVPDDDELAFVVAHELAHNILRHKARLKAAGIQRGLFETVGTTVSYIRRSEIEADLLGIALMANAGYDPQAAVRFWRWFGPKHFSSILLARTHPRWSLRAAYLEREARTIAASRQRPYFPPILAERDRPMSKDWEPLVRGL